MIANFLLYFWEFVSRRDFAGLYLTLIALACFWFAARSLLSREAVTFGLRGRAVTGPATSPVAYAWLVVGGLLLTPGLLLVAGAPV